MNKQLLTITKLKTAAVNSFTQAQQHCLWALIEKGQSQNPSGRSALLRFQGIDSDPNPSIASSNKLIEQYPFGSYKLPLKHLERVWKSSRGSLIGCEPYLTNSSQETAKFLLDSSYHSLLTGGCLVLAISSPSESRRFSALAIQSGFEVGFVRCNLPSESRTEWDVQFEEPIETLQEPYNPSPSEVLFLVASRTTYRPQIQTTGRKQAYVYNCYLETGGGGERSSLDFAAALDELGYEVSLVTTRPVNVTLDSLRSSFGVDERFNWPILYYPTDEELREAVDENEVEVFVNHTFSSYTHNPAPIGIYVVMFPIPTLPSHIQALLSYDTICCISEFSAEYVGRFWYENLPTDVVYPPISKVHQSGDVGSFESKERLVLQIGRFNTEGHSKCQLEAIETFCHLRNENILGANWKMKVVGRINSGSANERYVERCRELIANSEADIEIISNASLETIRDLYRKSTCLWQFTGFGLDFGEIPQFCEHLGLVAMDCFSYGTIPIIYQRSGMVPHVNHGENGFCFGSQTELIEIMRQVAREFGTNIHKKVYSLSKASADKLSFGEYRDSIHSMLWRIAREKKSVQFGKLKGQKDYFVKDLSPQDSLITN